MYKALIRNYVRIINSEIFKSKYGFRNFENPKTEFQNLSRRTAKAIRSSNLIVQERLPASAQKVKSTVTTDIKDALHALESPILFKSWKNWISFWILKLATQQLVNTVTVLNANETAHNGSFIGHVVSTHWWFNQTIKTLGFAKSMCPNFIPLSLERGRGDLWGADFAFITPVEHDGTLLVKIMLIQAKRRTPHTNFFSITQMHGSSGHSQLDELISVDDKLLSSTVPPRTPASARKLIFDSACYYAIWDRFENGRPTFSPIIKSARSIHNFKTTRTSRGRKAPNQNDAFVDSCDLSTLISLHFLDLNSRVGVILPILHLSNILSENNAWPPVTMFISDNSPDDTHQQKILKILYEAGYRNSNNSQE